MEIYENITAILEKRQMTKKDFAQKLVALEPKSSRTGEPISEKVVYRYLSGEVIINPHFIPYIAEVLNITEQELFDTSANTRKKCFKYFLQNAKKDELEYFHNFINSQIHNNININYGKVIMNTKIIDEKLEKFTKLLQYGPVDFMDKVLAKLEEYKKLQNSDF